MNKRTYCVTDFGAVCNAELQTKAIQAAIDACYLAGGGEVTIPAGRYRTGGLHLRSRVTLHLLENAVLEGSRDPEDYTGFYDDTIESIAPVEDDQYSRAPAQRWYNALIRAYMAHDLAIIGEKGSEINGMDCFDALGEEDFRGPHATCFYGCRNIELSGYTIRNSGNWAHCVTRCQNVYVHGVNVQAGHDGIHVRGSDRVIIEDSVFHTGDDSIGGYNNRSVAILRCDLNSACSTLRFGGTDVLVDRCRMHGPGIYGHRMTLTREQQMEGVLATPENSRNNTLNAVLYFCRAATNIPTQPGNFVVQNCEISGIDRLFNLNFNKGDIWCAGRGLNDITFRNCRVEGVRRHFYASSNPDEPITIRLEDVDITAREGCGNEDFMLASDFRKIEMVGVTAKGFDGTPVIRISSRTTPSADKVVELTDCDEFYIERV